MHRVIPELLKVRGPDDNIHRGLGLYSLRECGYRIRLSPELQVQAQRKGGLPGSNTIPVGLIGVTEVITEEMRRAGASITWIEERAIKRPEDYACWPIFSRTPR